MVLIILLIGGYLAFGRTKKSEFSTDEDEESTGAMTVAAEAAQRSSDNEDE